MVKPSCRIKCCRTLGFVLAVVLQMLPVMFAQPQPKIPPGSKVYIQPMDGLETYLAAGLAKKKVPLVVVPDRENADFEITGMSETEKVEGTKGWQKVAEIGLSGTHRGNSMTVRASWSVKKVPSGEVVFAYSVVKETGHPQQSAAEAFAKHLKNSMQGK